MTFFSKFVFLSIEVELYCVTEREAKVTKKICVFLCLRNSSRITKQPLSTLGKKNKKNLKVEVVVVKWTTGKRHKITSRWNMAA